jgi:hypothetical protein
MILREVIHEGAVLAVAGMVLGTLGATAATRLLGTMLFQVQAYDPLAYSRCRCFRPCHVGGLLHPRISCGWH